MAEHESEEDHSSGEEDDEHSQKLALFQEITGLNDISQCRRILQTHQWNVETAVQDALNVQEGIQPVFNLPSSSSPSSEAPPSASNRGSGSSSTVLQAPIPSTMQRDPDTRLAHGNFSWLQWLLGFGFLPIRWVLSVTNEIYQTLVSLLFGSQPPASTNPVADVRKFVSEFEQEYGTNHPPFLCCSYSDALERAKRDLQFLLIYLHSSGHQDTGPFCREVIASQTFRNVVSNHDCQFWGVGVDSEEGARVSYILRETTYPFLALVMLKGSRMTVVGRLEGYGTAERIVEKLQQTMSQNEPELIVLRTERHQRDQDQMLRQQQEEEFMKSLRADQEKARKREEEMNEIARQEELRRQKVEAKRKQAEELKKEKEMRMSRLPPEPIEGGVSSTVHISMKMPDGARTERRFSTTDLLQSLYDFAYTYDDIPNKFTLFTSYPKKELVCNEFGGPSLEELGFSRKVLVFVQGATEDEEDDEEEDE